MTTIRIDKEVYRWIQSLAKPFEDTPNSVLRRVARLEENNKKPQSEVTMHSKDGATNHSDDGAKSVNAKLLAQQWKVQASHVLYHRDGLFYENLKRFPGALFDPNGYVLFQNENDYRSSPYLNIGQKLNIRDKEAGIASIPGYRRMLQ